MPIKIVQKDEQRVYRYHDFEIDYRPIPRSVFRRIVHECTERGRTDWEAVADRAMEYSILRWRGLVDAEGKEVEYSPDKIDLLPMAIISEFTEKLLNDVQFEAEVKNLKPSSARA